VIKLDSKINFSDASVLLLAALPSLVFYLFIPFFWNNTDALVYLTQSLNYALPQYPPLYNGLCRSLMLLSHNGPIAIYVLILLQQVVYVAGLLYLAMLFSATRSRLIFLAAMSLNLTVMVVVNGVFPEGLFAGLELFFWGGFIRFLLGKDDDNRVVLIWTASLILMALTKHIGQFWYVFVFLLAFVLLIAGRINKNSAAQRLGFKLATLTVVSFVVFFVAEQSVFACFHSRNKTVIGRQGIYRIKELPWNTISSANRERLITHYTGWSKDPMLPITYNIIIATHPWVETVDSITNVLASRNITDKNADDCLNDAFKAYMFNMENNGFTSAMSDLSMSFSAIHLAGSIININTISLFGSDFPEDLKEQRDVFFSDKSKKQVRAIYNSDVFNFLTGFDLETLTKLALILFGLSFFKLRWKASAVLFIPVLFAFMVMAFTCLITVFLLRYVLASYMEVHMVGALLLAICLTGFVA
jgi:hypothetical protein